MRRKRVYCTAMQHGGYDYIVNEYTHSGDVVNVQLRFFRAT
jgi:hypothetical protein